jgi:hypothetical protein
MSTTCISCGMPMTEPAQFALGDTSKDYCVHCARPDGSMRSYQEALHGMTQFMMRSQGLAEEPAREAVKQMMARLPAWSER